MNRSSSSKTSILNQSHLSLQRAKQNLSGLKSVLISKQISPLRPINSKSNNSFIMPKKYISISINNKNSNNKNIGLVSPINNEILNNNRAITGNNVELSNRLNNLMGIQINNQNDINQKINELIAYGDYIEEQLKISNDNNSQVLNSYEELNIRVKDTIVNNNKIENDIKEYENENNNLLKANDELKRNLIEISKRFNNESQILKDYYLHCNQNYNDSMERNSYLNNLNKNLQKSKSDYNELINKMKETINIISNKKNSQSLDLKQIEKNLNDKDNELERRDEQLKELQLINNKLIEEGNEIEKEINGVYDELTSHQQLGNQLINIKDTLNQYDYKIEELKEIIRKKDREIEEIKVNYNDINKILNKRKNRNDNFEKNEINKNIIPNSNMIYKKNYIKPPLDYNKINNEYKTKNINFTLNDDLNDNKKSLRSIYDEEIKKIKQSNDELNINEKKNHSQRLIEENRKLQQEYLNLIGKTIDLEKMEKKYENNPFWNNINLENENNDNLINENEKFNDENLNQINKIINIESKLIPIEEEQKDEKGEESNSEINPVLNMPLQMRNVEENKEEIKNNEYST